MPILRPEPDLHPPDLFAPSGPVEPWRVAHVRSRQEKRLARYLLQHGVAFYLPQEEKRVRRRGRWLVSHLPLFPGYVFFRGSAEERRTALGSDLIASILEVRAQDQLERELADLWTLQRSGAALVPHPYLAPGDEVAIVDGPFRGWTGTVVREKGRLRLVVSVSLLRRSVAAELERAAVAPLPASRRADAARPVLAKAG